MSWGLKQGPWNSEHSTENRRLTSGLQDLSRVASDKRPFTTCWELEVELEKCRNHNITAGPGGRGASIGTEAWVGPAVMAMCPDHEVADPRVSPWNSGPVGRALGLSISVWDEWLPFKLWVSLCLQGRISRGGRGVLKNYLCPKPHPQELRLNWSGGPSISSSWPVVLSWIGVRERGWNQPIPT